MEPHHSRASPHGAGFSSIQEGRAIRGSACGRLIIDSRERRRERGIDNDHSSATGSRVAAKMRPSDWV
ncbi:hypothetical protein EUGRSUZ_I01105 [Eucalyptus grandis]|uniref:Uncharacterized protein n=2 Tax=Eucalyptus grandis TaxID=71139 RepID=A0ACC3JEK4_EUCGR|nr:hypothetical protein EUGRSUZ_I01105 [Eucalyptus grandis]